MEDTIRLNDGRVPVRHDRRRGRLVMAADPWRRHLAGSQAGTFGRWIRSGLVPVGVRGGKVALSFEEAIASRTVGLALRCGFATEGNAAALYRAGLAGLRRLGGGFPGAALVVPVPTALPLVVLAGEATIDHVVAATWSGAFVFRLSRRLAELHDWFDSAAERRRPAAVVIAFAGSPR